MAETTETEASEADASTKHERKTRTGTVTSTAMDKTIAVEVTRRFMHPMYKKYVRDRKSFKAHDPDEECRVGDKVLIEETRPLSKDKHWRLLEVTEKAPVV
jgi:small subunit ribosomal protein S17